MPAPQKPPGKDRRETHAVRFRCRGRDRGKAAVRRLLGAFQTLFSSNCPVKCFTGRLILSIMNILQVSEGRSGMDKGSSHLAKGRA